MPSTNNIGNDKDKLNRAEWIKKNKNKIKEYNKRYYRKNKTMLLERSKAYWATDIAKENAAKRQRAKWKDPHYRWAARFYQALGKFLRRKADGKQRFHKYGTLADWVGCDKEQLFEHLLTTVPERYDFYKDYGSHLEVDHIEPIRDFDLTKAEDRVKCFHYSNLRFMPASINRGYER